MKLASCGHLFVRGEVTGWALRRHATKLHGLAGRIGAKVQPVRIALKDVIGVTAQPSGNQALYPCDVLALGQGSITIIAFPSVKQLKHKLQRRRIAGLVE